MDLSFTDKRLKNLEMGTGEWFNAQKKMIKSKPLIKRCYDLWYQRLLADVDSVITTSASAKILELGSGSSYIKELRPDVITSDVTPGAADCVIDARHLPFENESLKAILASHVIHHIPNIESFFAEADRTLVPGGVISMIECTHTPFAKFFFSKIHPEPYNDRATDWSFPQTNSMLDSNQALSWLIFCRDKEKFKAKFPNFEIEQISFLPWATYLLSGGVNLKSLIPERIAWRFKFIDDILKPLDALFAIHWHITLRKRVD